MAFEKKAEEKEWKVLATLAEIPKNKADVIRVTRVDYGGRELVNLQVWRTDNETGKTFPIKDQKITFSIEYKDKVAEAIQAA